MAHMALGGSNAHRWSRCTASAAVAKLVPDSESGAAALEGNRLHDVAAKDLELVLKAKSLGASRVPTADRPAVSAYIQHCYRLVVSNPGAQYWIETKVLLAGVSKEAGGTADFAVYFPERKHLEIVDYKSGKELVDEFENDQMVFYALAVIETYKLKVDTVDMTIVQPNVSWAETVRTHSITAQALFEAHMRFMWAATLIEKGEAEFVAGDHCKYCPVMLHCPLLKEMTVKLKNTQLVEPNNEHIAEVLEMAEPVGLYLKKVKDVALKRTLDGQNIPHHKLIRGRGSRVWLDANAVVTCAEVAGVPVADLYETELRSVAALEKYLGKAKFSNFMPLVANKEGVLKLVHESEKGQAVDPKDLTDFGAVE